MPASYESMFTTNIIWTVLQGIVWFGVFTLIFQFHPWHALGLGLATMLLVTGLATMGVESLLTKPVPTTQSTRALVSNQPVRQSVSPRAPDPAAPPADGETRSRPEPAGPRSDLPLAAERSETGIDSRPTTALMTFRRDGA